MLQTWDAANAAKACGGTGSRLRLTLLRVPRQGVAISPATLLHFSHSVS
jgi:hypothetical protein